MSSIKINPEATGAKPGAVRVVAITGTIAAGKSTLGRMLEEMGWKVIDADEIVHRLYERGAEGYRKLVDALGVGVLSYSKDLDRGLLAAAMIRDPSVTATVNHLIHPLVREIWKHEVQASLRLHPQRPVAVVIPLLFETGAEEAFDLRVMVGCRASVSRQRLRERGLTPEAADFWLGQQWTVEEKIQRCEKILWNEGSLELLRDQAKRLAGPARG
ncbi:MAG: dephospho-CoA kinase [Verrucomicrobia bacterium]|nr:dephospho-CoA kinase [Verrucomicrobiota bacterium]